MRDSVPCDEFPLTDRGATTTAWLMNSNCGGLWGNGKWLSDDAGEISPGQVLTMQVDLDAGTLKFWVDGKPHGPGWTSGVTGPLRWAVTVTANNPFNSVPAVSIMPDPVLE